jgi:hypothetical protein
MEIWGGIGRGMRGSSCVYVRGVWRFSFPCNLSLSSPNPLIGPITSPAMVVWFSPKVSMLCMYKLPLLLLTPVVQRVTVSLATMNRVDGRAARERQARHEGTRAGPSSERTVGRPRLHTLTTGRTPVPLSTSYHYLPAPRSSFVGRERDMAEVKRALAGTRLLTLTGTGGSGKTRLALEVARDLVEAYSDGVWLVELAPLSQQELVPKALAEVLEVPERPAESLADTLAEALQSRELLLVLDNCEHLLEATARLVDSLLDSCPQVLWPKGKLSVETGQTQRS